MEWIKKQQKLGYLFVIPSLIGVTLFFIIPLLSSFLIAFTNWTGPAGRNLEFIGLDNFVRLAGDSNFKGALVNNLLYLLHIPFSIVLGFALAYLINKGVYFKKTLRAAFFMPYLVSVIAVGFVWMLLFHPTQGPINILLSNLGVVDLPGWLSSTDTSLLAIMIISTWQSLGFNFIIYMAALQDVPKELIEAAGMDGAKPYQVIRHVIIPYVSPITFFLLMIGIMNTFKNFGLVQAVTGGGPANSTNIIPLYIYQTAFRYYELGYASAIALVLFILIFIITMLQWYGQKKWVNY